MANGDLLRRAIVRATKELWLAEAAADQRMSAAWLKELTRLLEEYQRPLDTIIPGPYYTGTSV